MLIITEDNKTIDTHKDEFYSVDKNLEIHRRMWCRTCKHFSTIEAANEYVKTITIKDALQENKT